MYRTEGEVRPDYRRTVLQDNRLRFRNTRELFPASARVGKPYQLTADSSLTLNRPSHFSVRKYLHAA